MATASRASFESGTGIDELIFRGCKDNVQEPRRLDGLRRVGVLDSEELVHVLSGLVDRECQSRAIRVE